jgi:hypothetical protein
MLNDPPIIPSGAARRIRRKPRSNDRSNTPAVLCRSGPGSTHVAANSCGALDAGKNYKLQLPPNILVKEFWSVIVYSNQTRSMLQTDQ